MSHEGENSRTSGWNRRFIEEQFGKETADRLRRTLMTIWRQVHPTLPSERPESERRTHLARWQLGLAALYAEAEDPSWATKLTEEEARLAARYAPIELNGLPLWMQSLVEAHPEAVDAVLGNELSWELKREHGADGHVMLLQDINHASEPVARLFLPRLRVWLEEDGGVVDGASNLVAASERLRQILGTVLKHGDDDTRACARAVALQRLQEDPPLQIVLVWLPTLMHVDPELGVSRAGRADSVDRAGKTYRGGQMLRRSIRRSTTSYRSEGFGIHTSAAPATAAPCVSPYSARRRCTARRSLFPRYARSCPDRTKHDSEHTP